MKKMMMILALLFAMVGSSFGEWINNATVIDIHWYSNGNGYLTIDGTTQSTYSLATPHFTIQGSESNKFISLGLNALNNGNPVSLDIDKNQGIGGNPLLIGIVIKRK